MNMICEKTRRALIVTQRWTERAKRHYLGRNKHFVDWYGRYGVERIYGGKGEGRRDGRET